MQKNQAVARIGKKPATIWTIGHSNVNIDTFLELLQSVQIQTVIDCRSKPQSRWRQFSHTAIARHLVYADIYYEWRGKNIGGLGGNIEYGETLDEITGRASSERIAIMCSEGKPEQCHRGSELTPELEKLKQDLPTRKEFVELVQSYLLILRTTRDLVEEDEVYKEMVLNLRVRDDSAPVIKLNPPYDLMVDLSKIVSGRGERT